MKKLSLYLTCFLFITNSFAQKPKAVFGNLNHEEPYDRSEILLQEELNITHRSRVLPCEFEPYRTHNKIIRIYLTSIILPLTHCLPTG